MSNAVLTRITRPRFVPKTSRPQPARRRPVAPVRVVIDVKRPIAAVFDLMADPRHWMLWNGIITDVQIHPGATVNPSRLAFTVSSRRRTCEGVVKVNRRPADVVFGFQSGRMHLVLHMHFQQFDGFTRLTCTAMVDARRSWRLLRTLTVSRRRGLITRLHCFRRLCESIQP